MCIKTFITIFFGAIVFSSCSNVYSPAFYRQDIAYQPKPASFSMAKTENYASAGLNYVNSNSNDFQVGGQFNISQGRTFNHFNLAYGAFGAFGRYHNGTINKDSANYFTNKFYGVAGGRASADFFIHAGRADLRIIGIEAAYSHEFGTYGGLRQYLNTRPGYYVDPRTDLFSVGLTTEIILHSRENSEFQQGIRGFLGTTTGHNNLDDTFYNKLIATDIKYTDFHNVYPQVSYFIKFYNYFGSVEVGGGFFIRAGITF